MNQVIFLIIINYFTLLIGSTFASTSDFKVTITDFSIKHKGPEKKRKRVSLILENKGQTLLLAKLIHKRNVIHYFHLAPGDNKSVEFPYPASGHVYLIPLSPPGQNIKLEYNKNYEVF
jgi:hypothetical protein